MARISTEMRDHAIAVSGEFVGTFLFLLMALAAAQVANSDNSHVGDGVHAGGINIPQLLYISLAFGFSSIVNGSIMGRVSGGLFNPAVTLGMCLVGAVEWFRGLLLTMAQILGGVAAAGVVKITFPGTYTIQTKLSHQTSVTQGLFIEMFLTAELMLAIYMTAVEKHGGNVTAPIIIGLAIFVTELPGIYYTGGSLNPARTFGPDLIAMNFESYHWIYWVGPSLGSVIAAGFYKYIKFLEGESKHDGVRDPETEPLLS